jgi:tripartite-type tricarboxylate transporter receptor subunit TctC
VFGSIAPSAPQISAGKLRPIGITSMRRSPKLREVPTIHESGLPGFEVSTWYGMLAPGATPRAVVERLNSEVVRILQSPDVRDRLLGEAFEVPADTPDQFAAIIKSELARWAKVVKATGARGG